MQFLYPFSNVLQPALRETQTTFYLLTVVLVECTVVEGDVINKDDTDEGIDKRKNNGLENDGNDNVEI